MADDKPTIHPDFRSAERINAPYVNSMMTPHYKKEVETEYKTTFDKYDNKYDIHDGALYRNDEKLFDVDNRKFVQTDVTDEFKKYAAFDYDEEGNLASLTKNPNNSFVIEFKGQKTNIPILFTSGALICSRVRCLKGKPITVIIYRQAGQQSHIYINDSEHTFDRPLQWCTQYPSTEVAAGIIAKANDTYREKSTDENPLIQISNPKGDYIAISVMQNYGEQLNTTVESYYTFLEDITTGQYLDGVDVKCPRKTTPTQIENTYTDTFITSNSITTSSKIYQLYQNSNEEWCDITTKKPPVEGTEGLEPIYTGETITIDGSQYAVYSASYNTVNYSFECTAYKESEHVYKYSINVNEEYDKTEDFNEEGKSIISYSMSGWNASSESITLIEKVIDTSDNNEEYQVSGNQAYVTVTETKTENVTPAVFPTFFIDDGTAHAFYTQRVWGTGYSVFSGNNPANYEPVSWYLYEVQRWLASGFLRGNPKTLIEEAVLDSVDFNAKTFTYTATKYHIPTTTSGILRSNCVSVGQNFWSSSTLLCSIYLLTPYQLYVKKLGTYTKAVNDSKHYVSYSNSNTRPMRYFAGTFPNSDYKFYNDPGTAGNPDVAWYETGGFRVNTNRGNWNILYYSTEDSVSDIQGISWSETKNQMGTLVTPWNKIDSSFYIVFTDDFMIYKNTDGRIIKVSIEEGNEIYSLFNNTFIVVNTTSYWNCWDVENSKRFHYATDYNNRVITGRENEKYNVLKDSRLFISSVNPAFNSSKDSVVSLQCPMLGLSWWYNEKARNSIDQCACPVDANDAQNIDVFDQGTAEDATVSVGGQSVNGARYKYSVVPTTMQTKIRENELVGVTYTGTSTNYSPDIFANYINGAGNNDFIKEGKTAYPIAFNNFGRPIFVFTVTGEALNVDAFFVIQGQYYSVMNEKIYALSYMNGYIQNQDAVIDVRGMKFVGNTPEIAFFWSEKKKAFYSYTGDGILQQIFDATKYSLEKFTFKYYYDETVQSIWIPTTAGLLCFGAKNTYLMEDIKDVDNIIFTENYTYVIHKNGYTILTYFHEDDFEPIPIELETSFYGVGNNEVSTIDRWQITLYDERHPKVDVKLSVRSITDVTVKAEEKVFHIGENDWDEWSHSILLSYSPKLIKGQGIRLYIETPVAIQKVVPHIADQGYSSTTKFQM